MGVTVGSTRLGVGTGVTRTESGACVAGTEGDGDDVGVIGTCVGNAVTIGSCVGVTVDNGFGVGVSDLEGAFVAGTTVGEGEGVSTIEVSTSGVFSGIEICFLGT